MRCARREVVRIGVVERPRRPRGVAQREAQTLQRDARPFDEEDFAADDFNPVEDDFLFDVEEEDFLPFIVF